MGLETAEWTLIILVLTLGVGAAYTFATYRLLAETQRSNRPFVYLTMMDNPPHGFYLRLHNIGATPAMNVHVRHEHEGRLVQEFKRTVATQEPELLRAYSTEDAMKLVCKSRFFVSFEDLAGTKLSAPSPLVVKVGWDNLLRWETDQDLDVGSTPKRS